MIHMNSKSVFLRIAVVIAIIFSGLAICAPGETPAAENKIRIGVFNTRAITVAYARSGIFNEKIAKIVTEANKAKANGNDKVYKQLDAELKMQQDKMHWQVYGNLGIDDILMHVRPSYQKIAAQAGVAAIAENVVYSDPGTEIVDVTEMVAEEFKPDKKTKEMMQEIIKKPVLSFEQLKQAQSKRNP